MYSGPSHRNVHDLLFASSSQGQFTARLKTHLPREACHTRLLLRTFNINSVSAASAVARHLYFISNQDTQVK